MTWSRDAGGGAETDLVERERELAAIERALDEAGAGAGRLVLVEGSPGVGKSRLLEVARDEAARRGVVVLRAQATELEADFAMGVVLQLFEPYLARSDGTAREALFSGAASLARPLFDTGDATERGGGHGVFHGLYWLTANVAEAATRMGCPGLLLSVDDGHWADPASLQFLCHLASRLEDLPIMVVLAQRDDDQHPELLGALRAAARVLTPLPLSRAGVESVVVATFPAADEEFRRACGRVSGGNPFLLVELLTSLAAEGVAPTAASAARVEELVPESVLRSALTRLARLGRPALSLATAMAMLGDTAHLRHAAALASLDPLDAARAADALAAAHLLSPRDPVSFAHPLIAAAVRADIPPRAAAQAHRRAAKLLSAEGAPLEEVATHLLAADADGDPWTVEVLQETARRAVARAAPGTAVRFLARALAEPPPAARRAELLAELAVMEAEIGAAEAPAHVQAALELAQGSRRRAEILHAQARALHHRGQDREAARAARLGLDQLDDADPRRAGLLADYLSAAEYLPELRPEVMRYAENQAVEIEAGRLPAHPMLVARIAIGLADSGAPAPRVRSVAEAGLAVAGSSSLAARGRASGVLALALIYVDELDLAERALSQAMEFANSSGSPLIYGYACYLSALLWFHRGHLDETLAQGEQVVQLGNPGSDLSLGWVDPLLARGYLERGDLKAARAVLEAGARLFDADNLARAFVLEARGQLALAEGRPRAALADLLAAGEHVTSYSIDVPALCSWRPAAAMAAAALGHGDQATDLACSGVARAREVGTLAPLGVALRAAGLLARTEHGVELLAEAVEVLARSPNRLEHSRALVDLGATWRRSGQPTRAREPLSEALEMATGLGANVVADRARGELRATGIRPRRTERFGAAALTPSELRVAGLAARGLSNPEIAQQLFVSTKTVEWHLGHAYQKLGHHSRQQLVDLLTRD